MTLKLVLLTLSMTALSNVQAAGRNLCDDMIEQKMFPQDAIDKCLADQGESDTYKANKAAIEQARKDKKAKEEQDAERELAKAKKEAEEKAAKAAKAEAIKKNIEEKKFTAADLKEKAYGLDFYAVKVDYKKGNFEDRKFVSLTPADALCSYLGYEKATYSEIAAENASEKPKAGFIIPKKIFSKKPEPYLSRNDEKGKAYLTQKYVAITCAKIISEDIEGTLEAFNEMKLVTVNHEVSGKDVKAVDDSGRSSASEEMTTTPYSYKPQKKDASK